MHQSHLRLLSESAPGLRRAPWEPQVAAVLGGAVGTQRRRRSWATPSELRSPIRSDIIKKGFERAPHRGLLHATGQIRDEADFQKPFIGISNYYIDLVPGHVHLQEFAKVVKEAVRDAGGVAFEFNTIGADDGLRPWPCPRRRRSAQGRAGNGAT